MNELDKNQISLSQVQVVKNKKNHIFKEILLQVVLKKIQL